MSDLLIQWYDAKRGANVASHHKKSEKKFELSSALGNYKLDLFEKIVAQLAVGLVAQS